MGRIFKFIFITSVVCFSLCFIPSNTKAQEVKTVLQPSFQSGINNLQIGPEGEYYITMEGDIGTFGGIRVKLWDYRTKLMINSLHISNQNGPGSGEVHMLNEGKFFISINQHILKVDLLEETEDTVFSCIWPEYIHGFEVLNEDSIYIGTKVYPQNTGNINEITNSSKFYAYSLKQGKTLQSKSYEQELTFIKLLPEQKLLLGTNQGSIMQLGLDLSEIDQTISLKNINAIRYLELSNNILIINEAIGGKDYYSPVGEGAIHFYSYPQAELIKTITFEKEESPPKSIIDPSSLVGDIVLLPNRKELIVKYGFTKLARISIPALQLHDHSPDLKKREIDGLSFNSRTKEFMFTYGRLMLFSRTDTIAIYALEEKRFNAVLPPPAKTTEYEKILYPLGASYVWGMKLSDFFAYDDHYKLINPNLQDSAIITCEGCNLMISPYSREWVFQRANKIVVGIPDISLTLTDSFHFKFPSWLDGDEYEYTHIKGEHLLTGIKIFELNDLSEKYYLSHIYQYFPESDQFLISASKKDDTYYLLIDKTGKIIKELSSGNYQTKHITSPNKKYLCVATEEDKKKSWVKVYRSSDISLLASYEGKVDALSNVQFDLDQNSLYFQTGVFNKEGELIMDLNRLDLGTGSFKRVHNAEYYSNYMPNEKRDLLFLSTEEGISILKLSTGEELYHSSINSEIEDNAYYYQAINRILLTSDGVSALLNPHDRSIQYYYQYNGSKNLILNEEGYYMCPGFNPTHFSFVMDRRAYPFKQFDMVYNRPDLLLKQSNLLAPAQLEVYDKAYAKRRLNTQGAVTAEVLDQLPKASIESDSIAFVTNKESVELAFKFTDPRSKVRHYNVWVNGVPLYGEKGKEIEVAANFQYLQTEIPLSQGKNIIEVACMNAEGLESLRSSVQLNCNKAEEEHTTYFIGIGVSEYADSTYNLQYAQKDVQDLEKMIGSKGKVVSKTLYNKEVTIENIQALRSILEEAKIDDRIILSYSGHGILTQDLEFYCSSYAMDFNEPAKHGISFEVLDDLLDGIACRNKVMLIDACNSGLVDADTNRSGTFAPGIARSDAAFNGKGIEVESTDDHLSNEDAFVLMQTLFSDVSSGNGSIVISASGSKEYAFESGEWNNGVFTYSILKGIKEQLADLNNDGAISISELQHYVEQQVLSLTHGAQRPTSRQDNVLNDFVLF